MDGGANPTTRNQITGWVPLHEAAWKGHLECCKKLLERRGERKRFEGLNKDSDLGLRADSHSQQELGWPGLARSIKHTLLTCNNKISSFLPDLTFTTL